MTTTIAYTEEQALLRDEARRWLRERVPVETVRALIGDARGDDESVWKELGELGWLGLTIDEEHGGAGLGAVELAVIAEESGRVLLPSPLLPHWLAATAIGLGASQAQADRWLPALATGEVQAVWAHVEPNGAWRAEQTQAEWKDGTLRGEKCFVHGAPTAGLFCVPVRTGGGTRVALVPADARGVTVEREKTLDATRRQGRLHLDGVPVPEDALLERPAEEIDAALLPWGCTAFAAESAGGAAAALDMTTAYAATRKQFGKEIGAFQAIKHPLVNVLIATEHARSLVYAAATAIDEQGDDAESLARMAKAAASDAYGFAASRAIQFHGGYGFTEECDAHLYMRRALASRPAFGDPAHHRARIADALIGS
ncbi:MAG: acyl-CoA dehydrogenase [Deltaproteobacteria bacterium]|nr:acyl-CoA dehydrogenase [Deltaproteobacteria bacterium]